ncbi:hypothetical protein BB561_002131 [Smittium simulii]|uniref:Uncharacterized protein n=1 Tax=Smittium simulii TaxID=133385 RepID=A0A2T9YRM7_9FUNG|nr:hypothetical protein BB561_002131 [Smittium simulii]
MIPLHGSQSLKNDTKHIQNYSFSNSKSLFEASGILNTESSSINNDFYSVDQSYVDLEFSSTEFFDKDKNLNAFSSFFCDEYSNSSFNTVENSTRNNKENTDLIPNSNNAFKSNKIIMLEYCDSQLSRDTIDERDTRPLSYPNSLSSYTHKQLNPDPLSQKSINSEKNYNIGKMPNIMLTFSTSNSSDPEFAFQNKNADLSDNNESIGNTTDNYLKKDNLYDFTKNNKNCDLSNMISFPQLQIDFIDSDIENYQYPQSFQKNSSKKKLNVNTSINSKSSSYHIHEKNDESCSDLIVPNKRKENMLMGLNNKIKKSTSFSNLKLNKIGGFFNFKNSSEKNEIIKKSFFVDSDKNNLNLSKSQKNNYELKNSDLPIFDTSEAFNKNYNSTNCTENIKNIPSLKTPNKDTTYPQNIELFNSKSIKSHTKVNKSKADSNSDLNCDSPSISHINSNNIESLDYEPQISKSDHQNIYRVKSVFNNNKNRKSIIVSGWDKLLKSVENILHVNSHENLSTSAGRGYSLNNLLLRRKSNKNISSNFNQIDSIEKANPLEDEQYHFKENASLDIQTTSVDNAHSKMNVSNIVDKNLFGRFGELKNKGAENLIANNAGYYDLKLSPISEKSLEQTSNENLNALTQKESNSIYDVFTFNNNFNLYNNAKQNFSSSEFNQLNQGYSPKSSLKNYKSEQHYAEDNHDVNLEGSDTQSVDLQEFNSEDFNPSTENSNKKPRGLTFIQKIQKSANNVKHDLFKTSFSSVKDRRNSFSYVDFALQKKNSNQHYRRASDDINNLKRSNTFKLRKFFINNLGKKKSDNFINQSTKYNSITKAALSYSEASFLSATRSISEDAGSNSNEYNTDPPLLNHSILPLNLDFEEILQQAFKKSYEPSIDLETEYESSDCSTPEFSIYSKESAGLSHKLGDYYNNSVYSSVEKLDFHKVKIDQVKISVLDESTLTQTKSDSLIIKRSKSFNDSLDIKSTERLPNKFNNSISSIYLQDINTDEYLVAKYSDNSIPSITNKNSIIRNASQNGTEYLELSQEFDAHNIVEPFKDGNVLDPTLSATGFKDKISVKHNSNINDILADLPQTLDDQALNISPNKKNILLNQLNEESNSTHNNKIYEEKIFVDPFEKKLSDSNRNNSLAFKNNLEGLSTTNESNIEEQLLSKTIKLNNYKKASSFDTYNPLRRTLTTSLLLKRAQLNSLESQNQHESPKDFCNTEIFFTPLLNSNCHSYSSNNNSLFHSAKSQLVTDSDNISDSFNNFSQLKEYISMPKTVKSNMFIHKNFEQNSCNGSLINICDTLDKSPLNSQDKNRFINQHPDQGEILFDVTSSKIPEKLTNESDLNSTERNQVTNNDYFNGPIAKFENQVGSPNNENFNDLAASEKTEHKNFQLKNLSQYTKISKTKPKHNSFLFHLNSSDDLSNNASISKKKIVRNTSSKEIILVGYNADLAGTKGQMNDANTKNSTDIIQPLDLCLDYRSYSSFNVTDIDSNRKLAHIPNNNEPNLEKITNKNNTENCINRSDSNNKPIKNSLSLSNCSPQSIELDFKPSFLFDDYNENYLIEYSKNQQKNNLTNNVSFSDNTNVRSKKIITGKDSQLKDKNKATILNTTNISQNSPDVPKSINVSGKIQSENTHSQPKRAKKSVSIQVINKQSNELNLGEPNLTSKTIVKSEANKKKRPNSPKLKSILKPSKNIPKNFCLDNNKKSINTIEDNARMMTKMIIVEAMLCRTSTHRSHF